MVDVPEYSLQSITFNLRILIFSDVSIGTEGTARKTERDANRHQ
jgi:hypothetical protein